MTVFHYALKILEIELSYEFYAKQLELDGKRVCTKQTEQTGTRLPGAFCIKLVSFSSGKCRSQYRAPALMSWGAFAVMA